ncbi:MAG: hypothetical protein PHW64_05790 [Sulfuricurvum sp.]|nr:hypothetical protein [Sulfuricurvum sp.]
MTIIDALKSIIKDEAIIADGNMHSHACIEEKDVSAKLKKLTISDLGQGHLVIGLDGGRIMICDRKEFALMSPIFRITKDCDHNRACDALLIKEKPGGRCEIAYIDLKSDSPTGYSGQFKSSKCFINYIESLIKTFCDIDIKIEREKYVLFHTDSTNSTPSIGKKTTRPTPNDKNSATSPMKFIVKNNMTISQMKFL